MYKISQLIQKLFSNDQTLKARSIRCKKKTEVYPCDLDKRFYA